MILSTGRAKMDSKDFLALWPYVCRDFHKSIPEYEQTQMEADFLVERAIARHGKRLLKKLMSFVAGGFILYPPNHREVVYGTRGEQRRKALGRV
jgi:hypothetical protein